MLSILLFRPLTVNCRLFHRITDKIPIMFDPQRTLIYLSDISSTVRFCPGFVGFQWVTAKGTGPQGLSLVLPSYDSTSIY